MIHTPENNDMIGGMRKNNPALCVAYSQVKFYDIL